MNIKEVQKAVGLIKTNLFKNSNSYSIGMLKSHFKGTGLQFKDHQVYNHGDDLRFIDWKMLAKVSQPYIKVFEEERNVEIVVCLDTSQSMFYGHNGISKLQAAIEISCLLYLLAKETSDFVHMLIFSDSATYLPKASGEKGIAIFLQELNKLKIVNDRGMVNLNFVKHSFIDENQKYVFLMKHIKKKRELVLLSDFNDFLSMEKLNTVLSNKHVHGFRIVSPLDLADKVPYMLNFKAIGNKGRHSFSHVLLKQDEEKVENLRVKRMKMLNVKDRYLENFIKEML